MRNAVPADHRAEREDRARLNALRQTVQVGIDDLEARRYKEFGSFADLESYLRKVAGDTLAKPRTGHRRR